MNSFASMNNVNAARAAQPQAQPTPPAPAPMGLMGTSRQYATGLSGAPAPGRDGSGIAGSAMAYNHPPMAPTTVSSLGRLGAADKQGVAVGNPSSGMMGSQPQGPSAADIQADMQRRQVGAQIGADPRNAAMAGYMMS